MTIENYFDWAATTPPDPQIIQKALDISQNNFANPSSAHKLGSLARSVLEDCRNRCAKVLGVAEQNIVFTSGGTEANHLPILSLLQRPVKGSVVVSAIEHPAIFEMTHMLKNCGWNVLTVQPDSSGIITAEATIKALKADTALVCIMAVNNETGAIQPIYEIADALIEHCKGKKKPYFHVDAVQAVGKIKLNLAHKGIDSAAISAHKIRGPRGVGLVYYAQRQEPFIRGGEQESGLRPGTENIFGIVCLTECLETYAKSEIVEQNNIKALALMESLLEKLQAFGSVSIIPQVRLERTQNYSPWILQAAFENIPGNVLVRALSDKGFSISTGSACSSRKVNRPVLKAMGISTEEATNAVRFSIGTLTEQKNIDDLYTAINEILSVLS